MEDLRKHLVQYEQEHLLQFWDELSDTEQKSLEEQISEIDMLEIRECFSRAMAESEDASKIDDYLEPLESEVCGSITRSTSQLLQQYEDEGLERIANGDVAVLLLAGGQGTRLGVDYPKGMYNVGLPSRKCLYQLQGERIVRVQKLATKKFRKHGKIPWYIMTSEATKEKTRAYFAKKDFFGLEQDNIVFFEQGTLPCLTFEGKIILETKGKIAKAPDGNGGLYRALDNCGILADMESRGVKYIHVYCVDNILIKMADPHFVGFCVKKGMQCGAKVVEKTIPTEAVGVVCRVKGKHQVVEYTEITLKTAQMRTADGRLKYNAGSICNHFFSLDFLKSVVKNHDGNLLHHIAKKKIPHITAGGELIKPTKPNGIKMEKFVFDVFPFADTFCTWEVLREDEFEALKNADGAANSTPTTCRHALYDLHYRFILNAGGRFSDTAGSTLPEIPGNRYDEPSNKKCRTVDNNKNIIITQNTSPPIDESRRMEMNGQGDSGSSSSDEDLVKDENRKTLVVEISPLVTYSGEGLDELVNNKTFIPPLIIASATESVGKSRIRRPSFLVDQE